MKIVAFTPANETEASSRTRLGFLVGDMVLDPSSLPHSRRAWFDDVKAFILSDNAGRLMAEDMIANSPPTAWLDRGQITLAAPILPSTILCAGSNYRDHNREKAGTPTSGKEPEFFIKTSDCVVGPEAAIVHDKKLTQKLDCETELAVVVGKSGRHIPVEQALDHVFGYTIVNDVTARDRQVRSSAEGLVWYDLGRGKAFDTSAPLGPCIVTGDEVGNPQDLILQTRINGELRQSATTADMIWSCAELISVFSMSFNLRPGMVIITGTPAGTAWSADGDLGGRWEARPGLVAATRYCQAGDVVECTIDKIGTLRNRVLVHA